MIEANVPHSKYRHYMNDGELVTLCGYANPEPINTARLHKKDICPRCTREKKMLNAC